MRFILLITIFLFLQSCERTTNVTGEYYGERKFEGVITDNGQTTTDVAYNTISVYVRNVNGKNYLEAPETWFYLNRGDTAFFKGNSLKFNHLSQENPVSGIIVEISYNLSAKISNDRLIIESTSDRTYNSGEKHIFKSSGKYTKQ